MTLRLYTIEHFWHEQKWSIDACFAVVGPWIDYAQKKKLDANTHILCDYTKEPELASVQSQQANYLITAGVYSWWGQYWR